MGYPLRIEDPDEIVLITSRTIGSRLWFINNKNLEYMILAYLAKYAEMYQAELYSFILMGNHYHLIARFPEMNKAAFMRSFNGIIAKLVGGKVETFIDGKLWGRRYADQALITDNAIEDKFFYCAVNPVVSGVAQTLREYELYNSFSDAVSGRQREFKIFERWKYYEALQRAGDVDKRDFIMKYTLKFKRLPQYKEVTKDEYKKIMWRKVEERRQKEIKERLDKGYRFATREIRKTTKPGARPRYTKTMKPGDCTPVVISDCPIERQKYLAWYREIRNAHREASERYRNGDLHVEFPPGTYRPLCFTGPPQLFLDQAA